jgi:methyl-accepting chemotaxis protein
MLSAVFSKQGTMESLTRLLRALVDGRPLDPQAVAALPPPIRSLLGELAERVGEGRHAERAKTVVVSVSGECRDAGQTLLAIGQAQQANEQEKNRCLQDIAERHRLANEQLQQLSAFIDGMSSALTELDAAIGRVAGTFPAVNQFIEESSSQATEIASAFQEINGHADDWLTRATENSATAEQLGAGSRTIMEQVRGAAKAMARLQQEIEERAPGGASAAPNHLAAIRIALEQSLSAIHELRAQSGAVGKIIGVIEGITKQTNLLALNAAILAAQSGAEGKSFSVVADEIRVLADRTARSAKEIAAVIGSVQEGADRAGQAVQGCQTYLDQGMEQSAQSHQPFLSMTEHIRRSIELMTGVARSMEEQTKGMQLFSHAIEQMTRGIQFVQRLATHHQGMAFRVVELAGHMSQATGHMKRFKGEHQTAGRRIHEAVDPMTDRCLSLRRTLDDCGASVLQLQNHDARIVHQAAQLTALSGALRQAAATLRMTVAGSGANGGASPASINEEEQVA